MNNVNFLWITNVFSKKVTPLFRQNHNSVGDIKCLPYVRTIDVSALFKGLLKLPVVVVQYHLFASFMGHAGHN